MKLTAALAMALAAGPAAAATITFSTDVTQSYSIQAGPNAAQEPINNNDVLFALPRFPDIGVLRNISTSATNSYRMDVYWDNPGSTGRRNLSATASPGVAGAWFLQFILSAPPSGGGGITYSRIIEAGDQGSFSTGLVSLGTFTIPDIPTTYSFNDDDFAFITAPGSVPGDANSNHSAYISECLPITYPSVYSCGTASISIESYHRLEVTYTYSVPEPTTWTLMILGFGGAGGALRRRFRGLGAGDSSSSFDGRADPSSHG